MALLMSIMNIASAAMYIDLYDKHKDKKHDFSWYP